MCRTKYGVVLDVPLPFQKLRSLSATHEEFKAYIKVK